MLKGIRSLLGLRPARSEADQKLDNALADAEALDHYFFFLTQDDLDAAAADLEQRGWTIVSTTLDGEDQDRRYMLHARQPYRAENLRELQADLDAFAGQYHGDYDGWQVPGVTEDL